MILPTGPTRSSCEMFQLVADSVSSTGLSDRNFSSSNDTPSRPTRSCRKITPLPVSSRTANASRASSGDSKTMAIAADDDVDPALHPPGGAAIGRPPQTDQRDLSDGVHVLGDVGDLVQPRQHEDLALLPLALAHQAHQVGVVQSAVRHDQRAGPSLDEHSGELARLAEHRHRQILGIVGTGVDETDRPQTRLGVVGHRVDHQLTESAGPDHHGRVGDGPSCAPAPDDAVQHGSYGDDGRQHPEQQDQLHVAGQHLRRDDHEGGTDQPQTDDLRQVVEHRQRESRTGSVRRWRAGSP